ncbi:MAG: Bor family protein [Rickettsiales bacterium]|jgi:hypothetical protein|nr:Bor family protein [Rickettsiales bacterium]
MKIYDYLKICTCALVLGVLCSCSAQRMVMDGKIQFKGREPDYSENANFFFFGLGQRQERNIGKFCGGAENIAAVETEATFINVLLAYFTGHLYEPRTFNYYCKNVK